MVPLLTTAAIAARPVMIGRLNFDEFTGVHSAERSWAMMRARLTGGSHEFPRGNFYFSASPGGASDGVVPFP